MKKQLVATLILFVLPFLFAACVSSILKEAPPTFSKDIRFSDPQTPFVRTKTSVYPSWKSEKTGNVISIISDCSPNQSQSLSQLQRLVEDSLSQVKVVREENSVAADKPALSRQITGELDGAAIEVVSVSFRKDSCGYVSTLSGKPGQIATDRAAFDTFNKSLNFE